MPRKELPEPTGPLALRRTANGKRKLKLSPQEKKDFRKSLMIDKVVGWVLTLEVTSLSYEEMAEELEITFSQLRGILRTEEFEEKYNEAFIQLGKDPRIEVTRSRIASLLPQAFSQIKAGLESDDVPWTAKNHLIDKVIELSGIDKPEVTHNDRKELMDFLSKRSETNDSVILKIPGKYMDAMIKYDKGEDIRPDPDVIEGDFVESDVGTTVKD